MIKYKIVADQLTTNIKSGLYKELKLPTESELIQEFDVGRTTIRNAINLLVDSGILYQIHGSGVYIREMDHDAIINTNAIRGISSEFSGHITKTKLVEFKLLASDEVISKKLKISVGDPVYFIKRVRYVDNKPLTVEYSYYNKQVVHYLSSEIAEGSIYEYLENDLKLKLGFGDKYISADKLSEEDATYFEQEPGDPTLIINEKVYLSNGTLFNSSKVLHNYQTATLFSAAKN
ncbi:Transcriptional regulator, GntR [Carnobacterium maltaromaticum]|uniref:GntR family transcriptional regulator n=1 Tax=Carnobacterium maltaromaticum TaxID=2751 RepID=UPI00191BB7B6|nr:GntR family transcriptional regulator [Carnobacterium maltaromaticum]CAD5899471.1 Transcriptional regulator, GntR [Carnobacterium maltaromaticum]